MILPISSLLDTTPLKRNIAYSTSKGCMLKRALKSSLWWGGGGKSNILEAIIWRVTLPHCSQLSDVTLVWFDGFSLSYIFISHIIPDSALASRKAFVWEKALIVNTNY